LEGPRLRATLSKADGPIGCRILPVDKSEMWVMLREKIYLAPVARLAIN
jgi:hypothetical protein